MFDLIISEQFKIRSEEKMELNKLLIPKAYSYQSSWYDWIEDEEINLRKTTCLDIRGYQET